MRGHKLKSGPAMSLLTGCGQSIAQFLCRLSIKRCLVAIQSWAIDYKCTILGEWALCCIMWPYLPSEDQAGQAWQPWYTVKENSWKQYKASFLLIHCQISRQVLQQWRGSSLAACCTHRQFQAYKQALHFAGWTVREQSLTVALICM